MVNFRKWTTRGDFYLWGGQLEGIALYVELHGSKVCYINNCAGDRLLPSLHFEAPLHKTVQSKDHACSQRRTLSSAHTYMFSVDYMNPQSCLYCLNNVCPKERGIVLQLSYIQTPKEKKNNSCSALQSKTPERAPNRAEAYIVHYRVFLSCGHFLVTGTPWDHTARIREVWLYNLLLMHAYYPVIKYLKKVLAILVLVPQTWPPNMVSHPVYQRVLGYLCNWMEHWMQNYWHMNLLSCMWYHLSHKRVVTHQQTCRN